MSEHPWGEDTGVVCYECGQVGHMARNCPYPRSVARAERKPAEPSHCPRCGHRTPGHAEGCGTPPTKRLHEWAEKCRSVLDTEGPVHGVALHFEALAQQQLAEARAARLPEIEVSDDDDFPF